MGGLNLRTDNDARYADSASKPDVKEHQQVHDALARLANQFDIDDVANDGDVWTYDSATGRYFPAPAPSGGTGGTGNPATNYANAAPGTVFRVVYAGGWPSSRPSTRSDIYFDLSGAPVGTSNPTWLQQGDGPVGDVEGVQDIVGAMVQQAGGTYDDPNGRVTFPGGGATSIGDKSITGTKLADKTLGASNYGDASIGAVAIADGAIGSDELALKSVTDEKLAVAKVALPTVTAQVFLPITVRCNLSSGLYPTRASLGLSTYHRVVWVGWISPFAAGAIYSGDGGQGVAIDEDEWEREPAP